MSKSLFNIWFVDDNQGAEQMFATSSTVKHARYRRVLAPGFSQATLDSLENIIMNSGILALMDKISNRYADKDVLCNIFDELHLLAFDILGELAYGKSFDMIQLDHHPFTDWLAVNILSIYKSVCDILLITR